MIVAFSCRPPCRAKADRAALGWQRVTSASGNTSADPAFEELYAFGGHSFSILRAAGELVHESGDDLEQIIAAAYPEQFNANNTAKPRLMIAVLIKNRSRKA